MTLQFLFDNIKRTTALLRSTKRLQEDIFDALKNMSEIFGIEKRYNSVKAFGFFPDVFTVEKKRTGQRKK
ncbi:MAG: hypothetical protein L6V93_11110 [Clostridiales bacterium]|nr:MAG: hypothetical protein L6V93_11110 [Clostridiales bacterium]